MLTALQLRLAGIAFALAVLLGAWVAGDVHGHRAGAAAVQAHWDAVATQQRAAAAEAKLHADAEATEQRNEFNTIAAKYEALTHAQPPSVADSVAAGVRAGDLRLRDSASCAAGGRGLPEADARSRALDAAATQALADRVQAAVAAVRAGDAADARERQLDAQVIGLQSIITAERASHP